MMTRDQIDAWCVRNNISAETKALIQRIREQDPERKVRSFKNNVPGFYSSKKMGMTIQFESHTLELRGIFEYEHDSDVLEYYDQPWKLKLKYWNLNGRVCSPLHTPDYFIIRDSSAGFEEWKPVNDLLEKNQHYVGLFQRNEQGKWEAPAGKEAVSKFDLYYRVNDDSDEDGRKTINYRNLMFLEDYMRLEVSCFTEYEKQMVQDTVRTNPGITLIELLQQAKEVGISADSIYQLLIHKHIFIDLGKYALGESHYAKVFLDQDLYKAFTALSSSSIPAVHYKISKLNIKTGEKFIWDGNEWTFLNAGEQHITAADKEGNIVQFTYELIEKLVRNQSIKGISLSQEDINKEEVRLLLESAEDEDFQIAIDRQEILLNYLQGYPVMTPPRTLRHWNKKYKEAEMNYGQGYLGLLPKHKERGNRNPRIMPDISKLMKNHIENDYLTIKQKRIALSYGSFSNECEKRGYMPVPSYKAYAKVIREVDKQRKTLKREGKRVAYQYETPYLYLNYTTPRHGDRVFQIGHIDHTQLDIELKDSRTGRLLGKPWVTFMVDAFNRRILAFYLTFDPPSYRSCMMVFRECVRRHSRLPEFIIVDGGKEFQSIYFDKLLAMYEKKKKVRPPAKARFGSVCERLFGKSNTQFISALLGNTQATKKVRQMTKATNPKKHATWTFEEFHKQLSKYVYEIHDDLYHPALGMSPREAYDQSIELSGKREGQLIAYNDDFIILTLPSTEKGTAMVHAVNGVKINNVYYNHSQLKNAGLARKQVPVRYDPFDMGVAYVYAQNRWVKCISQYYAVFKGRTEKEIQVITAELKGRNNQNNKYFTLNAKKIALFVKETEEKEQFLKQRWKDMELRLTMNVNEDLAFFEEDEWDEDEEEENDVELPEFEGYGEL